MENMSNKEIQDVLSLLNQTIHHHKLWFNSLIRGIICQLPHDQLECTLDSGIMKLDNLHQELHQQAEIFSHAFKYNTECKNNYDNLITTLEKFNTAIYAYQKELEMAMDIQSQTTMTANMITMLPILREQQTFAKRQLQICHISLIDIDLLNKIENEYGYEIKEKVLINIAHLLVEHVRAYDKVFCYSNEAFLISLQNIDATQALDLIDRLRIKISKTPINIGLPEPLYLTVSCGIAALDPAFTIDQSLEQANIALYLAKTSGRNNTKLWGG